MDIKGLHDTWFIIDQSIGWESIRNKEIAFFSIIRQFICCLIAVSTTIKSRELFNEDSLTSRIIYVINLDLFSINTVSDRIGFILCVTINIIFRIYFQIVCCITSYTWLCDGIKFCNAVSTLTS